MPALLAMSPLRPEQLGDEARVGATLAVAHPESSTASFPSCEVVSHALGPKRGHRETGMGDGAPCGRDSVAPTPETGPLEKLGSHVRMGELS